jgi:apolipoprotein N-acyltransferase
VKRTTLSLIGIAALFAASGAVAPQLRDASDERGLGFIFSLPCSIFLFVWCKAHAGARGIDPPTASTPLVALLAPIGVPYYFLRSMPLPAALWAIVKSICYFIGVTFLAGGAAYVSSRHLTIGSSDHGVASSVSQGEGR